MTPYETTRRKLVGMVQTFQATNYPSMEVNYPKKRVTDVEHALNPFVKIELNLNQKNVGLRAGYCVRVHGMLMVNHFAREGCGEKIFTDYSDLLHGYLGLKTVNGVTFQEVQQYNNSGLPGFEGVTHAVNFYLDFFNV